MGFQDSGSGNGWIGDKEMIGILSSCSSEQHLIEPVIDELNKLDMDPWIIGIPQNDITGSYNKVNSTLNDGTGYPKVKFILAVADRPEQMGGVLAAFQNRIPIGHLYAGDHNTVATFDDTHRHAITLYSRIQFCSNDESMANVRRMMREAGLASNAYTVGATHFDSNNPEVIKNKYRDYKFNFPNEKGGFVLVSINSETYGDDKRLIAEVLDKASFYRSHKFVQIRGNGDDHVDNTIFTRLDTESVDVIYLDRCQHDLYLYLMMNCLAFITNSSAAIYEAPHLLREDQIVMVGLRNKGRTSVPIFAHDGQASNRIANLIKRFLDEAL